MSDAHHKHYRNSYGGWAGNPRGCKPDYERCAASISPNEYAGIPHQCRRKRGHGPDGAFCKQHDPEVVQRRENERAARESEKHAKREFEWHGRRFAKALHQIANGHNDPRALAEEMLDGLPKRARRMLDE